jgi:2,5-dioxopentanoate dehydrogenase
MGKFEKLSGDLFIGSRRVLGTEGVFRAINPATGAILEPAFSSASKKQIDQAAVLADQAFDIFRNSLGKQRALLLERIADGIDGLGQELLNRATLETGLSLVRLQSERLRTTGQLRIFADVARNDLWQSSIVEPEQADRQPSRRPDLRMRMIPLGPIAMFGASNFPFAFSVAGGDTAAAFAVGCPVVVKAHPSHPGTSEMVATVVQEAVKSCGFPEGVFSMISGIGHQVGEDLVAHPLIQSVAFTGSKSGGLALCRVAQNRAQPIPVYAEMSSTNPVFLLNGALSNRNGEIAKGFIDSVAMGVGQMCTSPGVLLGIKGPYFDNFCKAIKKEVHLRPSGVMLNPNIHTHYLSANERLSRNAGVEVVAQGLEAEGPCGAQMNIYRVNATNFSASPILQDEIFGPTSIIIECEDFDQMKELARNFEGQLTATLHIADTDFHAAFALRCILERKVGRLIVNGFPTGVEVSAAMVHGGAFPATTDSRATSVGSKSIERFLRPVCYQDFPADLLAVSA